MTDTYAFVTVRGNIVDSRLVTPIDGDELERDMTRRLYSGLPPLDRPYTTVQITNARVLPRDPGGAWTAEEACVSRRMLTHPREGPNGPPHLLCINRDAFPPIRFFMDRPYAPAGPDPIVPEHELANGLDVILLLRVSLSPEEDVRVDSVILMEPIRYRERP